MAKDTQSRKWQLTINNPREKGFSHEEIKTALLSFKSLVYWCMCDEVGENGTYHTHLFICSNSAVRFSTVQKAFNGSHIEPAKGTSQQNRDYILKENLSERNKGKKETNLPDTFEEFGEMPVERQGSRNDLHDLYDMIKGGMSNYEIIDSVPDYMLQLDKIERVRQIVREEQFKNTDRVLDVTYIFGASGTGKSRGILDKYGRSNVYRVTDVSHPFDGYAGQDIIVFEEFYSSDFKIRDMLNYLDRYPLMLPCRYNNKVACYTKVFIVTNVCLSEQYKSIQSEHPETFNAFLRRINNIKIYHKSGEVSEYDFKELQYEFVWNIFPQSVEKCQKEQEFNENNQKPEQIRLDVPIS